MPVLFLTAYGTVESAVAMMKSGACHYFVKPPDYPELKAVLRQAIEQHGAKKIPALHKKPVKPLKIMESQAIADALMQCNGNKSKAARQLGISRKKFYKRLAEFAER
ncbi:MAG: helix-turn-helix domain-containing protein [Nitrospirota bacterium]